MHPTSNNLDFINFWWNEMILVSIHGSSHLLQNKIEIVSISVSVFEFQDQSGFLRKTSYSKYLLRLTTVVWQTTIWYTNYIFSDLNQSVFLIILRSQITRIKADFFRRLKCETANLPQRHCSLPLILFLWKTRQRNISKFTGTFLLYQKNILY